MHREQKALRLQLRRAAKKWGHYETERGAPMEERAPLPFASREIVNWPRLCQQPRKSMIIACWRRY